MHLFTPRQHPLSVKRDLLQCQKRPIRPSLPPANILSLSLVLSCSFSLFLFLSPSLPPSLSLPPFLPPSLPPSLSPSRSDTDKDKPHKYSHARHRGCDRTRVKRDLLQCQKRPITVSKETNYLISIAMLAIGGAIGPALPPLVVVGRVHVVVVEVVVVSVYSGISFHSV